jgi:hypothetical protein
VLARVLGLKAGRATIRDHDGRARARLDPGDRIDGVLAVLGGRAATEELLGVADDFGCSGDDARALEWLPALSSANRGTRALVRKHRDAVERVARELLERGTLSGREIDQLICLLRKPASTIPA